MTGFGPPNDAAAKHAPVSVTVRLQSLHILKIAVSCVSRFAYIERTPLTRGVAIPDNWHYFAADGRRMTSRIVSGYQPTDPTTMASSASINVTHGCLQIAPEARPHAEARSEGARLETCGRTILRDARRAGFAG